MAKLTAVGSKKAVEPKIVTFPTNSTKKTLEFNPRALGNNYKGGIDTKKR